MALQRDPIINEEVANRVILGTDEPELARYRLLCSVATTFGVTYYDAAGIQAGDSATVAVNALGGVPVALPAIPAGAVVVMLTHTQTTSRILYYAKPGPTTSTGDFQAHPERYPSKPALTYGTRLGRS
jgi:hypothetical protein